MKYKRFLLKNFPGQRFPQDLSCFDYIDNAQIDPSLKEGQALVKVIWISLDPILRTWISGAKSYLDPVKPGSPIPGFGIGKVVKICKKEGTKTLLQANSWCVGIFQWSQYIKVNISALIHLPLNTGASMYKFLTIYGPTGYTSYVSIKQQIIPFQIQNPKTKRPKTPKDMNIVISSVAGGVGLTVAEYLSKLGYKRVYGIAGSDQKCKIAKELGCKDCINYKKYYDKDTIRTQQFENAIRQMIDNQPVDIYYQNVGEDMLSSMLQLMANHSKIIMCGATATYNTWGKQQGIRNYENVITKRIQIKGILYFNDSHNERMSALMEMMAHDMKGNDVIIKGIQKFPSSYRDLIYGKFIGKPVVQLWEDGEVTFD